MLVQIALLCFGEWCVAAEGEAREDDAAPAGGSSASCAAAAVVKPPPLADEGERVDVAALPGRVRDNEWALHDSDLLAAPMLPRRAQVMRICPSPRR